MRTRNESDDGSQALAGAYGATSGQFGVVPETYAAPVPIGASEGRDARA